MEQTHWIEKIKEETPLFLERLKGKQTPGFFHYSLSGDLFDETTYWGLGNTVFATKIYYTLDLLNTLPESYRKDTANFIKSFQTSNGTFFDPLIAKQAFWRDKLSAVKHRDFNNFFHEQTVRAETRQAISALSLLNEKSDRYPENIPKTMEEVKQYLERLDWTKPWGAGSHFSHLLFFLSHSQRENKKQLIEFTIDWVNALQHPEDGAWYRGHPSLQQKINGAMKVLTGFKTANRMSIRYPERLIDLTLKATNDQQACDHFNIIFVLKYANKATRGNYRYEEIREFALDRLTKYQNHYWPKHGGFSFFLEKANSIYYNAVITQGLPEPDIHGTTLFLWGLALIAQILDQEKEWGLREFVT